FGHGTAVASTLAGNDTGIGTSPNDGNAEGAKLYFQDIGTVAPGCPGGSGNADVLSYLPQDYGDLFGPPGLVYNDPVAPVRIHSDSWGGTDNVYDTQARMVDAFVWAHPDMTILFAPGGCGRGRDPPTVLHGRLVSVGPAPGGGRDDPERRPDPGPLDRLGRPGHRIRYRLALRLGHVAQQRAGIRTRPPLERAPRCLPRGHLPNAGGRWDRRTADGGRRELHLPRHESRA